MIVKLIEFLILVGLISVVLMLAFGTAPYTAVPFAGCAVLVLVLLVRK
jgi:hypothetical protein